MSQKTTKHSQSEEPSSLYFLDNDIPKRIRLKKNWEYGYDEKYNVVVISKDGTLGDIYNISGLRIGLPDVPEKVHSNSKKQKDQYWQPFDVPKAIYRVKSIFQWKKTDNNFKSQWVSYIEEEFDRREYGFWFMNNGVTTYMTGSYYMYLQWTKIDVGHPEYRESNRIFYLFWEACKADPRCYGMVYLKNRRSGFSFMASSELVNIGTLVKDSDLGIMSKTGQDAKKMFTGKVVPISVNYPFFFKPVQDGMDKPKTEISYRVPASRITKKNMDTFGDEDVEGLNTTIDWKSTDDNSYDGQKLKLLVEDESGKILKPQNILNHWRVAKTCLKVGRRVIGKCMMGSTCNSANKGGENFKKLYQNSNVEQRDKNGQTKTGLYSLFIPMEWNYEGFIDRYGFPVFYTPDKPVLGIDGLMIEQGVIDHWNNEVEGLRSDPDSLNEHYRQFPRTESHAFRDEAKNSLYNLTKIYQQIDYNDSMMSSQLVTRGNFNWANGEEFTEVYFSPDIRGDFLVSWIPKRELQNRVEKVNGSYRPLNNHIGSFGCDSYDIKGVVGGGGSKGALSGLTKYHMEDAPTNHFFLQYIARPSTPEIFYKEVLKAMWFYGMAGLFENNKPRMLYYLKNNGCRNFSINRPDSRKLSPTEKELGGIPSSGESKLAQSEALEIYIEKYVGIDMEGRYREAGSMGDVYFNRMLEDWAKFDIDNREKFDITVASSLAAMANMASFYKSAKTKNKISVNFAKYDNKGGRSKIIQ